MKVWTKDEVAHKLATDDVWLKRGLMAIYNLQTDEEKNSDLTREDNGIGFNAFDASILSDMAKQLQRTKYLSVRQLVIVRKCMRKYAGQLARIANGDI